MRAWTRELVTWVNELAIQEGFDVARVATAPGHNEEGGKRTADRVSAWLQSGRAGEMDYLKRRNAEGELLRASARAVMPWARSVIVCAFNYNAAGPHSLDNINSRAGWIARYAWNGDSNGGPADYHQDLLRRLKVIETELVRQTDCQAKSYVDTGPILERDFAERAGVGWIGKNTVVLNQQMGSWLLLGVIVTSLPVESDAAAALSADRCGSCTRCIEACPTGALVAAREMDASLCISYLTIEKKGNIAPELREAMGRQIFGCDICQEVCPWNRRAPVADKPGLKTRPELINPELGRLASMGKEEFRVMFGGSPLERTKLPRLHRNIAIAMGNSGDKVFIEQLKAWGGSADAVLAEAAQWSLNQLLSGGIEEADGSASIRLDRCD